MKKYTTEDFQKAQFARADDGLLAIRAFPGEMKPWLFVTKKGTVAGRPDGSMAREDWEPVTPAKTLTRSEFYGAREAFTRRGEAPSRLALEDFAHRLGVTVVPEPTNAEKLRQLLRREALMSTYIATDVARRLDELGVNVPESK